MKIKIKPKAFGPLYVHIDAEGNLRYGADGADINDVNPRVGSPADCLLYSLGSCIAMSIQIAAAKKKVTVEPFHVEVRASKAEDMPSRFGRFEITVGKDLVDDENLARDLLTQAKKICTVSNTLNAEISLSFES